MVTLRVLRRADDVGKSIPFHFYFQPLLSWFEFDFSLFSIILTSFLFHMFYLR